MILLFFAVLYLCFRTAFYVTKSKHNAFRVLDKPAYLPYRETMQTWMEETKKIPYREVCITSYDGLKLYGKYYEYSPSAPVELMMHGYRGTAERDLCGGVQRAFSLGHSALIVDQRGCGKSEGRVITFGIKERHDCRSWIDFMIETFGQDVRIILCGISMGAATVLMAAGEPLPKNVIGVLADCGYTSPRAIICSVIRGMHLPPLIVYPFVKLSARIFGGFRLDETSALDAVKSCTIPVVFIHGEADDFVPCDMSRENFAACTAKKRLLTVPGAVHGMSYLVDADVYLAALRGFWNEEESL